MHIYTTGQWVLLFFFYCFCGWVWESCYVSLCKRRWVNRGFLHGPLLPIYGSGAILILFVTLPVQDDLALVYLLGTAAATILEYFTGAAMERLFKVRYWDYSKHPLNLHGYICLSSSIAWGFFAILLVRYLHPPVARMLARVPAFLIDPLALLLTVCFTVDVVRSVQAALDLKEVLTRLTEENQELRHLARRAELLSAFAEDDLKRFRAKTELDALLLHEKLEADIQEQREKRAARFQRRRAHLEAVLRRRTAIRLEILSTIQDALENCRAQLLDAPDLSAQEQAEKQAEVDEALEQLHSRKATVRNRTDRIYRRAVRLLRGNPSAVTHDYQDAMDSLRTLDDDKHSK